MKTVKIRDDEWGVDYLMVMRTGKAFAALILAAICFCDVFAAPCPNCSTWDSQAYHDAKATRMGRCKKGTIPKGCVPIFNKSEDFCLTCIVTVRINSPSDYRRCPRCSGKGEIPDKIVKPKEETTPTETPDTNPAQEKKEDKPSIDKNIVLIAVKKCDTCDENGKVAPVTDCAMCESGFNHNKDGNSYKCRLCSKVCASRFAQCCKPDCPKCGNMRGKKIVCPICAGDKIITPLEEAKNKERMADDGAKQ